MSGRHAWLSKGPSPSLPESWSESPGMAFVAPSSQPCHLALQLPEALGPEFSDAHRTWLNFVLRPDDGALKKRCRGRDKKSVSLGSEPGAGRQLVAEAFHCRLKGPVQVDKKTLVELQGFQAPTAQGAFLRGSGLSLASGRHSPGYRHLPVLGQPAHGAASCSKPGSHWGAGQGPRAGCALTLGPVSRSLEAISGLEGSGRIFTVLVQGLLQLQAGQYASVFVDNGSGAPLTVQSGSSFSGLLLGT
ncbi:PREDICTED: adipolin [Myotis brandtii]|uniref:adipolin n=1 Tax=Myotis brandtii TaxID=109478 RepID=UPI000703CDB4|nr:PREDICTED: adipolin [Myotis brandtii]